VSSGWPTTTMEAPPAPPATSSRSDPPIRNLRLVLSSAFLQ
jgi:hypothetical protein